MEASLFCFMGYPSWVRLFLSIFIRSMSLKLNSIRRECKSHYIQWLRKAITAYVARRATPPKQSPMTNKGVQPSYDFTFKLVLLGEYQVGKTSLIYRYTDDTFVEAGAFLGCAFKTIAVRVNNYLVQVRSSSSSLKRASNVLIQFLL